MKQEELKETVACDSALMVRGGVGTSRTRALYEIEEERREEVRERLYYERKTTRGNAETKQRRRR